MIGVVHHHQVLCDRPIVDAKRHRKQPTVRHLEGGTVYTHICEARLLGALRTHHVGGNGRRPLGGPHRHLDEDHTLIGTCGRDLLVVRWLRLDHTWTEHAQRKKPDEEE